MLYDPDDPNQALYKGNMQPIAAFSHVESIGLVRGKAIHRTISDPRGISYEEYQKIDKEAVTAFGSMGTKTIGTWPRNRGSVSTGAFEDNLYA